MIIVPILTSSLIHFSLKGWENVLFELGSERVNPNPTQSQTKTKPNAGEGSHVPRNPGLGQVWVGARSALGLAPMEGWVDTSPESSGDPKRAQHTHKHKGRYFTGESLNTSV